MINKRSLKPGDVLLSGRTLLHYLVISIRPTGAVTIWALTTGGRTRGRSAKTIAHLQFTLVGRNYKAKAHGG